MRHCSLAYYKGAFHGFLADIELLPEVNEKLEENLQRLKAIERYLKDRAGQLDSFFQSIATGPWMPPDERPAKGTDVLFRLEDGTYCVKRFDDEHDMPPSTKCWAEIIP